MKKVISILLMILSFWFLGSCGLVEDDRLMINLWLKNNSYLDTVFGRITLFDSNWKETTDYKIYINWEEVQTAKSTWNYYDDSVFYDLSDLERNKDYLFELDTWEKLIKIVSINVPDSLVKNFDLPAKIPKNKDFKLTYSDLSDDMELIIARTIEIKEENGSATIKGWWRYWRDNIIENIINSSGEIVIPKSYFEIEKGTVTDLWIMSDYEKKYEINDFFNVNSSIKVVTSIDKLIPLVD